jgi:hypothetical protein
LKAIPEEGVLWAKSPDKWFDYNTEKLAYEVLMKGVGALEVTLKIAIWSVSKAEEEISAKLAEASKNAPGVGKLMELIGIPEKDRYLASNGQTNTKAIRAKLQRELNIFSLKELSVTTVFVVDAMAFKAQASLVLFGYDIDLIFAFSFDPKRLMEQMVNIAWDFLMTTFCKAAKKVLPKFDCETNMLVRTLDDVGVGVKMVMTVKKIPIDASLRRRVRIGRRARIRC